MWVRVATFEGGDTEKLDRLMDERTPRASLQKRRVTIPSCRPNEGH